MFVLLPSAVRLNENLWSNSLKRTINSGVSFGVIPKCTSCLLMNCKRVLIFAALLTALAILVLALTTKPMEEKSDENIPQYLYTEKEMEKISDYITQQYGDFELVAHEMVSPDIHCDIVIVPPTDEQPYYKLVTMGAGAYKMNVPKEVKSDVSDRAEYVVFLPKDWNLESDKEEDYWPLRMLKTVARLPIWSDDWLGLRHTVNLTEDESPVAENTEFNSCTLVPSVGKDGQLVKPLRFGFFGKKVAFFQIYPLYQEELTFKMNHSFEELMDMIDDDDLFPLININRKNYGK